MNKARRCDKQCHEAKGSRCKCWCGGFYHGSGGDENRESLQEATKFLDEHGGKSGEVYREQLRLPV